MVVLRLPSRDWLWLCCRPIPERELVEAYIKAYYLPESQLEAWVQEHKVPSVCVCVGGGGLVCVCVYVVCVCVCA